MKHKGHLIKTVRRFFKRTKKLPRFFFPNSSDQKFEIAILISIVERSINHASGDDTNLQVPGESVVSFEICPVFTYSIYYWEVKTFFGEGDFSVGKIFCRRGRGGVSNRRIYRGEGSFRGWTFKGKLYLKEFTEILKQNSFYFTYFLLPIQHLKIFRGNSPSKIFKGVEVVR